MSKKPKRKPYGKGLTADYEGATPEQVVEAVLRYRPANIQPKGKVEQAKR